MSTKKKAKKNSFLFRWLKHPGFLASYTAISAAGLYFYSKSAFDHIRLHSKSLSTDFWLRSLFYVGLLFFSLGVALLFDRFANGSRWVIHVFGPKGRSSTPDPFGKSPIRSGQAQFYIAILLAMGFGWWGFDKVNGSFHSWYKTYGQYYTRLRSPKVKERVKAIAHLAKIHNKTTAKLLKEKIAKGEKPEKLAALWMAGKSDFSDPLVIEAMEESLDSSDPLVKETALLALSRVVTNPKISTLRTIEEGLKASLNSGKPPAKNLLFAAAFLRSPEFLRLFLELYKLKDETTSVILSYAIVWIKGATPLQERRIITRLSKNLSSKSKRLKCMATIGLTFKYESLDDPIMTKLRREFEAKSSVFKCPPEVFSLHPQKTKQDTINITRLSIRGFKYPAFGKVRYRERLLRILALNRDDSMIPWFKRIEKNQHLPKYLRALAGQAARKKLSNSRQIDW